MIVKTVFLFCLKKLFRPVNGKFSARYLLLKPRVKYF